MLLCVGGPSDGARVNDCGEHVAMREVKDTPFDPEGSQFLSSHIRIHRYIKDRFRCGDKMIELYRYEGLKQDEIFPLLISKYPEGN